ncbi:MAG: hypothetical protein J5379_10375 [Clostridiales bacterium]|nr:hypothetical protein [Clostridiales bacterium]
MAYERIADSLFEKYSSSGNDKSKAKVKKSKKQDKPVLAEYTQLPREPEPKVRKKSKKAGENYPQVIYVRIAGMNYRFQVDSDEEKAKTLYCAKVANDLLAETLEENPMIPTNQALILAYMEACFRWQTALASQDEKPKEAPLLPLEQYCKENNIPMEEL